MLHIIKVRKNILLSLLLIFGLALSGGAQAQDNPAAVIQTTSDEMIRALKANKADLQANPEKITQLVEEILVPRFDFATISQWVMGRSWRGATSEQKEDFTSEFKTLLINAYAGVLLEYTDETITILPLPKGAENEDELTVRSEIISSGKAPVAINYAMIKNQQNAWMVYDVTVEGISIVTSYRSEVRDLVASLGIDGMINRLKEKNRSGLEKDKWQQ